MACFLFLIKGDFMNLSKKELSSVVHLLNDTVVRLIDAVDNDVTLTARETTAMRNALCQEICGMNMDDILQTDKNARRLLLKRGNGAENDGYVGLLGEVTVDTDVSALRVHDGQTSGGIPVARMADIPEIASADYVVAWQNPTAENGYTWYRKYKSGWVEQGGCLKGKSVTASQLHTLPIEMADTKYTAVAMNYMTYSATGGYGIGIEKLTTTSFNTRGPSSGSAAVNEFTWYVCGVSA